MLQKARYFAWAAALSRVDTAGGQPHPPAPSPKHQVA